MVSLTKTPGENTFDKSISHITLRFKNPILEKEFMKERSKSNQYFKLVLLSSLFSCFFMSLIIIQTFFQYKFEVVIFDSNIYNLLYISIVCFIGILLEILPLLIHKMRWFKGYFMTIPSITAGLLESYQYNLDHKNILALYFPIFICFVFIVIGISLIYCHNWICGEILILIVIILCEIYINVFPWALMDKLFITFEHLFSLITISTCIRFLEYKRRESFFRIYSLNQLIEATQAILMNLPDGLVVVENNKIIFANRIFENFCNIRLRINDSTEQAQSFNQIFIPQSNIFMNSYFPSTLKNSISEEPFLSFIENSKEIGDQNQFIINDSSHNKMIPFEIKSTLINSTNEVKQIVYSIKDMSTYQE